MQATTGSTYKQKCCGALSGDPPYSARLAIAGYVSVHHHHACDDTENRLSRLSDCVHQARRTRWFSIWLLVGGADVGVYVNPRDPSFEAYIT